MKFKKTPAFEVRKGSFAVKTKLRTPRIQSSVYFQADERKGEGRKKRTTNLKKRTEKQNEQRLIFRSCDCIYRILKQFYDILELWKIRTATGEWTKKSVRSYFMHRCLKFDIGDLLKDYLGLDLDYIYIYEQEDQYLISTKVIASKELITKEDLYAPRENRIIR